MGKERDWGGSEWETRPRPHRAHRPWRETGDTLLRWAPREDEHWDMKRPDTDVSRRVFLTAGEQTWRGKRLGRKAETLFRTEVVVARGQGGVYLLLAFILGC